jgi:hypothetical protein
LASPTNRRESPHKLSVSVFKELAVARWLGRSGILSWFFVFVNTLDFLFSKILTTFPAPSQPDTSAAKFDHSAVAFGLGRSGILSCFFRLRQHPRFFIFEDFDDLSSSFATRLATGIRCEGRAYYLPFSARQHLLRNFFRLGATTGLRPRAGVARKPHLSATA